MTAGLGGYVLVCLVALAASALTLFPGFGLGTLLLPAFAFVLPIEVAVAATAVVHLANNLFKVALLRRHADWSTVARFAIPGSIASILGALIGARLMRKITMDAVRRLVGTLLMLVGLLLASGLI